MKRLKAFLLTALGCLLMTAAGHAQTASSPSGGATLNVPSITGATTGGGETAESKEPLTAVTAFVNAPTEVFPTIDRMTRMDMVDYYNSGSQRPSKNAFKGDARILSASPRQLTVSTSDVSVVELSLLEQKKDTMIMVITTLSTPVEDSYVKLYTREWKPVDGLFVVPLLDDWTREEARERREDLENSIPFMLARCSYVPETNTLTLTNNLGSYLPEEALGLAEGSLRQSISYRWDGKRFVKVKQQKL